MNDFPKKYDFSSHRIDTSLPTAEDCTWNFSVFLPPMKISGSMYLSDVYSLVLSDIAFRSHRLSHECTFAFPAIDHSGIVLRENMENRSEKRQNDAMNALMQNYREYVRTLYTRYGISPDWEDEIWSLDERVMNQIDDCFRDLYEKGYIFYEESIAAYSPQLGSIIAESEIEEREVDAKLYSITYFISWSDKEVILMTTRPETLFGDVALAIHPKDKRYKKLIGKKALIPILNREIPIITDTRVDMNHRGGVMRITPAHDRWSYTLAKDHHLETNLTVIDRAWNMKKEAWVFVWQSASTEARANIIELIRAKWNLVSITPCTEVVWFCTHSMSRVEEIIAHQWFLRRSVLVEKVIAWYKNNEFQIFPEKYAKTFEEHLFSVRDRSISRQLQWWHPLPASYDSASWTWILWAETRGVENTPSSHPEKDVLDPYFTASFLPLIALWWEKNMTSPLASSHFPYTVVEAGNNRISESIIMMLMMGYEYTGKSLFSTIHLHGNILLSEKKSGMEEKNRNMFHPETREEVLETDILTSHRSDALRLALILRNPLGNDFHLSTHTLEEYTEFLNKLWNMTRFVWLETGVIHTDRASLFATLDAHKRSLLPHESWILSRLAYLREREIVARKTYEFWSYGNELFHFIIHEFSDFALEVYKLEKEKSLYGKEVLSVVILSILASLHPFAPDITSALSQHLSPSWLHALMEEKGADVFLRRDKNKEKHFDLIFSIINTVRSLRGKWWLKPIDPLSLTLVPEIPDMLTLEENTHLIAWLTRSTDVHISKEPPAQYSMYESLGNVGVYVHFSLDPDVIQTELERLETQIEEKKVFLRSLSEKLTNNTFLQNAPERIIRAEMEKRNITLSQIEKFSQKLSELRKKHT